MGATPIHTAAWSQVYPAIKGSAEAADADAAPDGSWWVCGYADHPVGTKGVWVAHYSASGEELFTKLISRGKDQWGGCNGIAVASEDGHRAVLTGGFGPTGLWPNLWVGLIDETESEPVLAESNDALAAYWGNDILVNKYGQFEVAGQRVVNGNDWDMVHRVYNYVPGQVQLTSSVGLTYGEPDLFDTASAIVENPDGTVTLIGTRTVNLRLTAAAVRLDAQHEIVATDGWPFISPVGKLQGAGAMDGAVGAAGNLQLTGWWRDNPNVPSQALTLTVDPQGHLLGDLTIEAAPNKGDNIGLGVAHLGDGTFVIAASVTTKAPDNHDIWLRRYGHDDGSIIFQGPYNLLDEPRRIRANAFDQTLVVGFETVMSLQDGQPGGTTRSQGWGRACRRSHRCGAMGMSGRRSRWSCSVTRSRQKGARRPQNAVEGQVGVGARRGSGRRVAMLRRGGWRSSHRGQLVSHVREGPQAHVDGSAGRRRLGREVIDRLKHGPLPHGHVVGPGPGLVEARRRPNAGVLGDGELKFVGRWLFHGLLLLKTRTNYNRYYHVSRTNLDARSQPGQTPASPCSRRPGPPSRSPRPTC